MSTMNINKHTLDSFYLTIKFEDHNNFKQKILDLISIEEHNTLQVVDNYYSDSISKLDWSSAKDFNRTWVRIIKPNIDKHLSHIALFLGYQSHEIKELWFQQYLNNDTHGWHIHGSNFTAVYYLELNEESPLTELICPFSLNKKIVPDVKEGDILLFPSYVIHRAPKINNNIRKTIISFNVDFLNIDPLVIDRINKL